MAAVIGKRKREDAQEKQAHFKKTATAQNLPKANTLVANHTDEIQEATNGIPELSSSGYVTIQIVTGSYERVLHGISARIPSKSLRNAPEPTHDADEDVSFSNTFLFAAHASSIRCLALSPPSEADKRILATGGSDERINLYHLSTAPPKATSGPSLPSLAGTTTSENPRNRPLGNLIHHDRAITALHFPAKSKLFSAAEDNTIAISRTRDWTVLSSIKAPIPKPQGRPSGDTAGPGEVPAGINDFAIHPSQKLMLSVSRGEKCMRLWNLMTGKKAGVLSFDRDLRAQVGEGKYGSGEGRRVLWNENGEAYVVGFERGAAVFGIDSKPKAIIRPTPPTKLHQMRFLPDTSDSQDTDILALSTEDGRILFFDARIPSDEPDLQNLPSCPCVAQLGGRTAGISGRIKDFEILQMPTAADDVEGTHLVVTGSSDGAVRLWTVSTTELLPPPNSDAAGEGDANGETKGVAAQAKQVGTMIGMLETGNRITCLGAFVMDGQAGADEELDLAANEEEEESESDSDE